MGWLNTHDIIQSTRILKKQRERDTHVAIAPKQVYSVSEAAPQTQVPPEVVALSSSESS